MNLPELVKKARLYLPLALIASLIIALDQWTKALVRDNIPYASTWLPAQLEWLSPFARIVHWYNTGAAFGSFQGYGWVFTGLAFVVVALILYYYPKVEAEDGWMRVAMAMQLAGALGNVIDRLTLGGKVTDFISVGTFPVFNVADSSITLGVILLLLGAWWKEKQIPAPAAESAAEGK
ncbi:MAG: signal peptidase II [Anaerolineales bacterium]